MGYVVPCCTRASLASSKPYRSKSGRVARSVRIFNDCDVMRSEVIAPFYSMQEIFIGTGRSVAFSPMGAWQLDEDAVKEAAGTPTQGSPPCTPCPSDIHVVQGLEGVDAVHTYQGPAFATEDLCFSQFLSNAKRFVGRRDCGVPPI